MNKDRPAPKRGPQAGRSADAAGRMAGSIVDGSTHRFAHVEQSWKVVPLKTSEQPDARLGMRSVVSAGEPIDASEVAEVALEALASGRFLALPHPEVDRMQQQKAADRDRWISGMQRFRTSLEA